MLDPSAPIQDDAQRARKPLSLRMTLVIAALCAIAIMWLNEDTYHRTTQTLVQIQHGHATRSTINTVVRRLVEAESGQRGFILTGDRAYLAPYDAALKDIDVLLKRLGANVPRAMNESEAMQAFRHLLSQKIGEMALTVRLRQEERAEVVNFVMTSNVGLEQMRAFQLQGDALLAQADAVVAANRAELYRLLNVSRFGLAAGVLAAFFAFFLYVNQTRTLRETDARQKQLLEAERDALESQVRERTARLTELATYLQQAVEDERAHLARELHDELGALLTAAKLDAGWIARKLPAEAVAPLRSRFDRLLDTLNQGIALKRKVVADLRPPLLSELGLGEALRALPDSGDIGEHGGRLEIELPDALPDVPAQTALALYRIAQEALTNVRRYAQARSVRLRLGVEGDELVLAVEDDGVGFDPAARSHNRHGLAGMAHRVQMLAGRLDIDSAPGKGTRITARVPFARLH